MNYWFYKNNYYIYKSRHVKSLRPFSEYRLINRHVKQFREEKTSSSEISNTYRQIQTFQDGADCHPAPASRKCTVGLQIMKK